MPHVPARVCESNEAGEVDGWSDPVGRHRLHSCNGSPISRRFSTTHHKRSAARVPPVVDDHRARHERVRTVRAVLKRAAWALKASRRGVGTRHSICTQRGLRLSPDQIIVRRRFAQTGPTFLVFTARRSRLGPCRAILFPSRTASLPGVATLWVCAVTARWSRPGVIPPAKGPWAGGATSWP